jgi:hypothetical protein
LAVSMPMRTGVFMAFSSQMARRQSVIKPLG